MLKLNERIASLDTAVGPLSDKTLLDTIADEYSNDPSEELQSNDIQNNLNRWIEELPEKQREVLSRRFGIRGYETSTLEDVGKEIGLTRSEERRVGKEWRSR